MSAPTVLVIADPSAPHVKPLGELTSPARIVITNDPQKLAEAAPQADAILYADTRISLFHQVIPCAAKARWVHSMWTGVEGMLTPELIRHPATLTNGRGVFRWPLADWVMAVMLHFAFDLGRIIR